MKQLRIKQPEEWVKKNLKILQLYIKKHMGSLTCLLSEEGGKKIRIAAKDTNIERDKRGQMAAELKEE